MADYTGVMTLPEMRARSENTSPIIDEIVRTNEFFQLLPFQECNEGASHNTRVLESDPAVSWIAPGGFVEPSTGSTSVKVDKPAMAKALSTTPVDCVKIFAHLKDPKLIKAAQIMKRMEEEQMFQRALSRDAMEKLIYGDVASDPLVFDGLAKRCTFGISKNIDEQVIDCTDNDVDRTDLTSIFAITLDPTEGVTGIYPRGTLGGIEFDDKGEQRETNARGGVRYVFEGMYSMNIGLSVRSALSLFRIANISVSKVAENPSKLIKCLIEVEERQTVPGKTIFLCNSKIKTALRQGLVDKQNLSFSTTDFSGKKFDGFNGIPIVKANQILSSEARLIK